MVNMATKRVIVRMSMSVIAQSSESSGMIEDYVRI